MRGQAGRFYFTLDIAPRAEAGVGQAGLLQAAQRVAIICKMVALVADVPLPPEPQPGQIVDQLRGVFRPAAVMVDVLDAQQQPGMVFFGPLPADQR